MPISLFSVLSSNFLLSGKFNIPATLCHRYRVYKVEKIVSLKRVALIVWHDFTLNIALTINMFYV